MPPSNSSAGGASSRPWWRAAPRSTERSSGPVSSTGSSSTRAAPSSAPRVSRPSPGRDRRRSGRRRAGAWRPFARSEAPPASTGSRFTHETDYMFTGLVEELGTVRAVVPNAARSGSRRLDRGDTPRPPGGARLEIEATAVLDDAELGASIAVNGCCLTAVELGQGWWAADAVEETLRRTCLGALAAGDRVNLERPVRLTDRLGGHIVQGHVDGVGEIAERATLADGFTRVGMPAAAARVRSRASAGWIGGGAVRDPRAGAHDEP